MVAAERDQMLERRRLRLDLGQAAENVAVGETEIADIREIQRRRVPPVRRMVAIDQHAARLADRGRTEPGARPVRGAEIEGNAGDANRGVGVAALDAEKSRRERQKSEGQS